MLYEQGDAADKVFPLTTTYLLPTAHYYLLLPTTYYLLLTAYYLLPTTTYLLLTTHHSLLIGLPRQQRLHRERLSRRGRPPAAGAPPPSPHLVPT